MQKYFIPSGFDSICDSNILIFESNQTHIYNQSYL